MRQSGKLRHRATVLSLRNTIMRACRCEAGATAIEYSLMAGLIALVIVAGVSALGTSVNRMFASVDAVMP